MTAPCIDIANAIVETINDNEAAGRFVASAGLPVGSFVAERNYGEWDEQLGDLADGQIRVEVVTRTTGGERMECAGLLTSDPVTHVAVRRKFADDDREADKLTDGVTDNPNAGKIKVSLIDQLVNLVDDFYVLFAENRIAGLTGVPGASWDADEQMKKTVDLNKARKLGMFEGFVEITFTFDRSAN